MLEVPLAGMAGLEHHAAAKSLARWYAYTSPKQGTGHFGVVRVQDKPGRQATTEKVFRGLVPGGSDFCSRIF